MQIAMDKAGDIFCQWFVWFCAQMGKKANDFNRCVKCQLVTKFVSASAVPKKPNRRSIFSDTYTAWIRYRPNLGVSGALKHSV